MLGSTLALEKLKQIESTLSKKRKTCKEMVGLEYVIMKTEVHLLVREISRSDLLSEVEINVDVYAIDNAVLWEI